MAHSLQKPVQTNSMERPPIVVVVGHIDHGKSTLLDYIRTHIARTETEKGAPRSIVEGEAGGITQHTSAYEVVREDEKGEKKKITFLDTPGHEAFSLMRVRGAAIADIAILVVAADDGVKPQTAEAITVLKEKKLPYIVVINKIDKPNARVEKTKQDLAEHGVYLEGYGGNISCAEISAKTGEGIPELLDLLLLTAELEELRATDKEDAEGFVIEAHRDRQKGISALLIVKDGVIRKNQFVVSGRASAPVRLMEDFEGHGIEEAHPGSPVRVVGFSDLPTVGGAFKVFPSKKEAHVWAIEHKEVSEKKERQSDTKEETKIALPVILKADTLGTLEALGREISKCATDTVSPYVLSQGVGHVSESDIKLAHGSDTPVVLGFHVKMDPSAQKYADQLGVGVHVYDIIYELLEWLREECGRRKPTIQVEETTGKARIIRVFSTTKNKQVIGGKVTEGKLTTGGMFKILRRAHEIGRGRLIELQQSKVKTKEVGEGLEFGAMIETKYEVAESDVLEAFILKEE